MNWFLDMYIYHKSFTDDDRRNIIPRLQTHPNDSSIILATDGAKYSFAMKPNSEYLDLWKDYTSRSCYFYEKHPSDPIFGTVDGLIKADWPVVGIFYKNKE